MVPLAVLCGGLGAALYAGTQVPRTENLPAATEETAIAAVPGRGVIGQAASEMAGPQRAVPLELVDEPLTTQYRPSRFPGVMVRHVPDAAVTKGQSQARWVVRGGKRVIAGGGSTYNAPSAGQINRVTLPNGTVRRSIPPQFKMAESMRLENGRVVRTHVAMKGDVPATGQGTTR